MRNLLACISVCFAACELLLVFIFICAYCGTMLCFMHVLLNCMFALHMANFNFVLIYALMSFT
jgi:hypothetical protein